MEQNDPVVIQVTRGVCHALFAYDVGLSINLEEADRRITANKARGIFHHKLRAPQYLEYRPAPLRVTQDATAFVLGAYSTSSQVEVVLFDFGAVSVTYKIPLEGPIASLLLLSEALYENHDLLADSRGRIEQLLLSLAPAIERPSISKDVEDYLIFEIEKGGQAGWTSHDETWARILRSERGALSEQEAKDATSYRISFSPDDAAIIDWNASLLFGHEMEDVRAVLEFANVELLEMRLLDHQLDHALDQAYAALSMGPRRTWTRLRLPGSFEGDSKRIAQLQVDSAILFSRVTNTLKLVGDQYLARVYRLVSQRFHLDEWDGSIARKLHTLDSIYGKMTDRASVSRMEMLEWIIIALIAISIAVSFHS
jgi:hypothetical protein